MRTYDYDDEYDFEAEFDDHDVPDDEDEDLDADDDVASGEYDTAELDDLTDEEDLEQEALPENITGESPVEISMEIDETGNEVWFAQDSRIPGSSSMGHSLEEAVDGVEERRRLYREMLRRSREKRKRRDE